MSPVARGMVAALALAQAIAWWGCRDGGQSGTQEPAIEFWHTFDSAHTSALNQHLQRREQAGGVPVDVTLLPFSRAMTILADVLAAGERCPDLVLIDATWLPGLASRGLLRRPPDAAFAAHAWLPEADELARYDGEAYALPQTLDGLALVYREQDLRGAGRLWPPESLDDLETVARRLSQRDRGGLSLRADGYWYIAFLRSAGGRFPDPLAGRLGIDEPAAEEALARMGALFADGAAGPSPAGGASGREIARSFRAGEVTIAVEGPWLARALAGDDDLGSLSVAPFPRAGDEPAAPRGGQLLAVPTCAAEPEEAWKLARDLTDPALQAPWAQRFGAVPTTRAGLEDGGPLARAFYRALGDAAPLPRHPLTAELFDDLTPAVRAAVWGDATAAEALAGVARGWSRLVAERDDADVSRDIDADAVTGTEADAAAEAP